MALFKRELAKKYIFLLVYMIFRTKQDSEIQFLAPLLSDPRQKLSPPVQICVRGRMCFCPSL